MQLRPYSAERSAALLKRSEDNRDEQLDAYRHLLLVLTSISTARVDLPDVIEVGNSG